MIDYRMTKESSVLYRHCREKHDGNRQKFKCDVTDIFGNDATLRQITEATDIRRERARMNNQLEWGNFNLPKLAIV